MVYIEKSMKVTITPEVKKQMFDMLEYSYDKNKEIGTNLFIENNIISIGDICIGDECEVILSRVPEYMKKIGSFHTHITNDTIDDVPSLTDYMTLMLFADERLACIGTNIDKPTIKCHIMKPFYEITTPLVQTGKFPQTTCLSWILNIDSYRNKYINANIDDKRLYKSLVESHIEHLNKGCTNIIELDEKSNKNTDIIINTDFNAARISDEIISDYRSKHQYIKDIYGIDFYK